MAGQDAHPLLIQRLRTKSRKPTQFVHTIYQSDMEAVLQKRAECRRVEKELKVMQSHIERSLRSGARVESGFYTPELIAVKRKPYRVAGGMFYRLDFKH